jgi:hypothetical protein
MLLDFSWSNSASRSITKSTRRSQATGMDAVVFPLVSKRNQPYPSCRADEKKRGPGEAQRNFAQKPACFLGRQFSNARRPGNGSSAKWRVYGLCPFFARYAYRVLILPRRPAASLTQTKRHKQPQPATRVQFRLGGVLQHSNIPILHHSARQDSRTRTEHLVRGTLSAALTGSRKGRTRTYALEPVQP